ncbi:hypothetical protein [Geopsychrobacter electrodiphilus]|uniref:hypothetical protein n=1 Tax=Geopsychrobacter electrodiphilus TaxID=225196 RepID=UPI00038074AF|nr:hypothetical protein [Geopsychrobacter electrodiphilus]
MKIDKDATRDRCRKKYGSVFACHEAFGVHARVFYAATDGTRGLSGRDGVAKRTIDRLRTEGLLVEIPETGVQ